MSLPREASELLARLELFGVRLGLEGPRRLLAALGDPQRRYAVVLVAGTSGKGSTAALLAAMAGAAGYRTGLYTSPHLEEVEERLRIDGRAVDGAELGEALLRTAAAADRALDGPPTYFEALTAAALDVLARREVELAVLEVGMGGRLDATNAAEPVLSLITSIGLEHRRHLGDTVEAIAREKAGILRSGRPALAWVEDAGARAAVRRVAAEVGTELREAAELARVEVVEERGLDGSRLAVLTPRGEHRLDLALAGGHQRRNAALAVLAGEALCGLGWERLDGAAIAAGVAACRWPGRLEPVRPPEGPEVVLDVAHNPTAAATLAAFMRGLGGPFDLVYGSLEDKEVERILPALAAPARRVVLTAPASPRAAPLERLAAALPVGRVELEPHAGQALEAALRGSSGRLLVCGSVVLVGEARRWLRGRFGVPPPAAAIPIGPAPRLRVSR